MTGPQSDASMRGVPVVSIGLEKVYATLLEVRDDVRDVKKDIGELSRDSQDHEARIRHLEQARASDRAASGKLTGKLAGVASTAGVIGGGLLTFLLSQIGG